jgi:hypothetical protein
VKRGISSQYDHNENHYQFVRNTRLPRGSIHEPDERADKWVLIAVILLFIVAIIGVQWAGW